MTLEQVERALDRTLEELGFIDLNFYEFNNSDIPGCNREEVTRVIYQKLLEEEF